jgi:hypothetical protein
MKTTQEVFKEILTETGFGNYKPSEMSNSDYWMCTEKAMERYANEFSIGFVEWLEISDEANNYYKKNKNRYTPQMDGSHNIRIKTMKKELLEIYKKTL